MSELVPPCLSGLTAEDRYSWRELLVEVSVDGDHTGRSLSLVKPEGGSFEEDVSPRVFR